MIAVIGFALAAFVLGDFLGYGPGTRQSFDIGKIDRHTISYQDFERRVSERIESWRAETGQQNVGAAEAFQIRQQIWNDLTREIILDQEFERLGLEVTAEELSDLIYGAEPHQAIVQSFSNPADGTFDPQNVINFLRNFDQLDPSVRVQWANLERFIRRERLETKYHTLISKAYYVPAALAAKDYRDRNTSADFRFVFQPYAEVDDTLVRVTDRQLRQVYDQNKERFRQEASRDIAYVSFQVAATEEDRTALREELLELKEEFSQVQDIAPFVNSVSDMRFDPSYYTRGVLPLEIDSLFFEEEVGAMYGPFEHQNTYILARLVDVQFRPDSMSASHILFDYAGSMGADPGTTRSPARARELADSVLQVLERNPLLFPMLATELSDDNSAQFNQGDLGWFADGDMVQPFNEAVINTPVGGLTTAESDFGVHVIRVSGKSTPTKKIQVAFLTRDIEPSSRTYQAVYARASAFASELRANKDFNEVADDQGIPVRVAEQLRNMDFSIPGVENPRNIIQWAFLDDTKEGSHSRIFELDNRFIIAKVTEVRDEGIPPLNQIRDEIMALAMRQQKYDYVSRQIRQAGGGLEEVASLVGHDKVEANDIRFNTINLPQAGNEPRVVGTVFALQSGSLSDPIKGNNGVFVVEVERLEEAIIPDDLTSNKRMMRGNVTNRVVGEVFPAIKNNARVEDNRNLFY